jgi:hypothetical protein
VVPLVAQVVHNLSGVEWKQNRRTFDLDILKDIAKGLSDCCSQSSGGALPVADSIVSELEIAWLAGLTLAEG